MTLKSIGILAFILFSAQQTRGSVYNGGSYSPTKVQENMNISPLGPDLSPAPFGPDSDRLSAAPLGQPFYVMGEDGKCYWGNFSKAKDQTAMIVYYQSPVSKEHCVYQSTFNPKPSGFSISVKAGGGCIPSHVDVEGEDSEWVLNQDGPEVLLGTCFGGLTSYGDNIDRKHQLFHPTVAIEKPAIVEIKPQQEVKGEGEALSAVIEVPSHAEPRGPSSVQPQFTLQLASYLSLGEANHAISKLKDQGVDAFVFSGVVKGVRRFRVCTGHFFTSQKARDFKAELAEKSGVSEAFVQIMPKILEQGGATTVK